jgi:putative hydrolase of the HAD superfamily
VFLDVGDTLLRAHPSWAHVYQRVLERFGVQVDVGPLRDALDRTFGEQAGELDGPFEATAEASYQRLKDFDSRVLALLGEPPQPDAFFRALEATFIERASWFVFEDTAPSLAAMRDAGLRLAVISNWAWTAPELLHALELMPVFEALIISDRVGYQKPHRGIFEHALDVMRVPASRAVHVGDSWRADIQGARSAGIAAVLIDRGRQVHGAASDPMVPVIHDLFGLLDLLGVARPVEVAAR